MGQNRLQVIVLAELSRIWLDLVEFSGMQWNMVENGKLPQIAVDCGNLVVGLWLLSWWKQVDVYKVLRRCPVTLVLSSYLVGASVELYSVRRPFLAGLLARPCLQAVFFKCLLNPLLENIQGVFRYGLVELLDALEEALYIQLLKGEALAFRQRAAGVIDLNADRYIVQRLPI